MLWIIGLLEDQIMMQFLFQADVLVLHEVFNAISPNSVSRVFEEKTAPQQA